MEDIKRILDKDHRSWLMGFAILWIIAMHFCMYGNLMHYWLVEIIVGRGYLGVDIFLFLSCYGLGFSYERNTLGGFYSRRLTRLFPMYLLFLAIVLFFYGSCYQESWIELAVYQVTGLASFRHTDVEWYVPALIVIYAMYPLLFRAIRFLYTRCKLAIVFLVILFNIAIPFESRFLFPIFAQHLPIVIVGTATYFAIKHTDEKFLLTLYFSCLAYAFFACTGYSEAMILPVCLLLMGKLNFTLPMNKTVSFLGKHSLEIYLAQSLALNHFFLRTGMDMLPKTVVALVIIVVGSVLFYYFQKLSLRVFKR